MQGAQVPSQIVEIGSNMLCCVTKKIEKEKIKNWSEEGPELARDERRKAEKEEERTVTVSANVHRPAIPPLQK